MGIGPSTKETTKHYFEDPMVKAFADDPDIDLRYYYRRYAAG